MQYTGTDSNSYFTIEEEAQGEITERNRGLSAIFIMWRMRIR